MSVSRVLKKVASDTPKCVGASIEFTKIEKWEVSKASLLEQKQNLEKELSEKQSQINEIDNLLLMFEV